MFIIKYNIYLLRWCYIGSNDVTADKSDYQVVKMYSSVYCLLIVFQNICLS